MLIPLKVFLGATCLTGSLAAGGVVGLGADGPAGDSSEVVAVDESTTTTSAPEAEEEAEEPTTTTTEPAPAPEPEPAPVEETEGEVTVEPDTETELPAPGVGTVNVTVNGDIIFVNQVNVLDGWTATVERSGDSIVIVFVNGDEEVRLLADLDGDRLATRLQRLADRAEDDDDGDRRWSDDELDERRRGDDREGWGRDGRRWDNEHDHRDEGRDRH